MRGSCCNRLIIAVVLAAVIVGVLSCGSTATIVSITVIPSDRIIVNGSMVQFIALATFSNGMTISPWSVVNWSSTDTQVATIGANGVVLAVSPGATQITATDMQHPTLSSRATLTVTNMPLVALVVTAANPVMARGTTEQLTAEGIYANGDRNGMTSSVIWSTSNAGIASVSNVQGSHGLVTAIAAGTVTITATELQTGIAAQTVLVITP
jgi:uncharacterized protein YjdB